MLNYFQQNSYTKFYYMKQKKYPITTLKGDKNNDIKLLVSLLFPYLQNISTIIKF